MHIVDIAEICTASLADDLFVCGADYHDLDLGWIRIGYRSRSEFERNRVVR
jgi:hypothetical protein